MAAMAVGMGWVMPIHGQVGPVIAKDVDRLSWQR